MHHSIWTGQELLGKNGLKALRSTRVGARLLGLFKDQSGKKTWFCEICCPLIGQSSGSTVLGPHFQFQRIVLCCFLLIFFVK